jgi:hypothetical protein
VRRDSADEGRSSVAIVAVYEVVYALVDVGVRNPVEFTEIGVNRMDTV